MIEEIDDEDIYLIENYALRWGIKGTKWYNGEWNFYEETEEEQEKILHIREKIITPLIELKNELAGSKTVKNITTKLYEFLIKNNIDKNFELKINELEEIGEVEKAKEYETSFKTYNGHI